jgi:hypothetical protein
MAQLGSGISLVAAALSILTCQTALPAMAKYERAYPPRMLEASADATAFYVEFRARAEAGGFGHSYATLGTIDASGRGHQTTVVGFLPKSADDDRWSKVGLPVAGFVGITRSDLTRHPQARFRVTISGAQYFHVQRRIQNLRHSWTTYELFMRNCNNFVSEIAASIGLRTPMVTVQYPVRYVTDLRTLNSRMP